MSHVIPVTVRGKIATAPKDVEPYVCGNSDYTILFDFCEEWAKHDLKTARFKYNGTYQEKVFSGNECPVPIISDTFRIDVGVYAGNLETTTAAYIPAKKSILCGSGLPEEPPSDVYAQLVQLTEEARDAAKDVQQRADDGEFDGDPGVVVSDTEPTDPAVQVWIDPSGDADQLVTAKDITGALGYTPAKQEDVNSLSEDIAKQEEALKGKQPAGDYALKSEIPAPEGVYELIETITLEEESAIERTAEPDGTPYRLDAVFTVIGATGEIASSNLYYHSGSNAPAFSYIAKKTNAEHGRIVCECVKEYGFWVGKWRNSWSANNITLGTNDFNKMRMTTHTEIDAVKNSPYITRIRTSGVFPAGSEIQIWGVRA